MNGPAVRRYIIGHLADHAIAFGIKEFVGVVCPQALMDVHPPTVVLEKRLGHECRRETVLAGDILWHVFVHHDVVGLPSQGIEAHIDFHLAGGGHLMMVFLDINAGLNHLECHFSPDVVHLVGRRRREITFFMTRPVAQIRFGVVPRIPDTFLRIDFVETHHGCWYQRQCY